MTISFAHNFNLIKNLTYSPFTNFSKANQPMRDRHWGLVIGSTYAFTTYIITVRT